MTVATTNRGARYEQARAHAGLGDLHDHEGRQDKATEHWRAALAIYVDLGAATAQDIRAKLGVT